jgi:hypothetical protein
MSKGICVHSEYGIFLGTFLGMGFWSKLSPDHAQGQTAAPLFKDEEEMMNFFKNCESPELAEHITFVPAPDDDRGYVNETTLIAMGIEGWNK